MGVCRHCGEHFTLCRSCWRGQRYCTPTCQQEGYRLRRKAATKRYETSPTGRHHHSERQRRYRRRHRNCIDQQNTVTHPSSVLRSADLQRTATRGATLVIRATPTHDYGAMACQRCHCVLEPLFWSEVDFVRAARTGRRPV